MYKTKSYTIQHFYQSYSEFTNDNPLYTIDYALYRKIVTDYFKYIYTRVVEEGVEFKLPCRLGTVCIVKHKPKNWDKASLRIDYAETKKNNKLIYHLNEHSDGYKFRFYWSKYSSLLTNKSKYQLVATRHNKRRLCQIIKNKERDYIAI